MYVVTYLTNSNDDPYHYANMPLWSKYVPEINDSDGSARWDRMRSCKIDPHYNQYSASRRIRNSLLGSYCGYSTE